MNDTNLYCVASFQPITSAPRLRQIVWRTYEPLFPCYHIPPSCRRMTRSTVVTQGTRLHCLDNNGLRSGCTVPETKLLVDGFWLLLSLCTPLDSWLVASLVSISASIHGRLVVARYRAKGRASVGWSTIFCGTGGLQMVGFEQRSRAYPSGLMICVV